MTAQWPEEKRGGKAWGPLQRGLCWGVEEGRGAERGHVGENSRQSIA